MPKAMLNLPQYQAASLMETGCWAQFTGNPLFYIDGSYQHQDPRIRYCGCSCVFGKMVAGMSTSRNSYDIAKGSRVSLDMCSPHIFTDMFAGAIYGPLPGKQTVPRAETVVLLVSLFCVCMLQARVSPLADTILICTACKSLLDSSAKPPYAHLFGQNGDLGG